MMTETLRRLRAMMNLHGITRKEAAQAMYLSTSALNRKLRGEIGLTQKEAAALLQMVEKRRKPTS